MPYKQHIKQAYANLISAKLRSFLALLGILVGTASVVALLSSGQLATEKALAQFKSLGSDLLALSLYEKPNEPQSASTANTLSLNEVNLIQAALPTIQNMAPYTSTFPAILYNGQKITGTVIGATENLKKSVAITMQSGGFVSHLDRFQPFVVLGQQLYQQILAVSKKDPIGQPIQMGKYYFTIIGVMDKWPENSFLNHDLNRSAIIPLQAISLLNNESRISDIVLRITPGSDIDTLQARITQEIKKHAPRLRIFYRSSKQIIKSMQAQHQIFTLLLASIGAISLIVGGIGVMNIMLASVAERHREIGIRKAIGARNRDIQQLFLVESVILALFGGMLGIIVGIAISFAIAHLAGWGFRLFFFPPAVGFTISSMTGIFFGFYPAYRASQLDPIQSLRYE